MINSLPHICFTAFRKCFAFKKIRYYLSITS